MTPSEPLLSDERASKKAQKEPSNVKKTDTTTNAAEKKKKKKTTTFHNKAKGTTATRKTKNNTKMMKKSTTPVLDKLFQPHQPPSSPRIKTRSLETFDSDVISTSSSQRSSSSSRRNPKSMLYTVLNPKSKQRSAQIFKWFISRFIALDFIIFIVSTEPNLDKVALETHLRVWEGLTSSIFLLEYLLRIVTITESPKYAEKGMVWGRVQYVLFQPSMIIDLLATAPFFIEMATGWELPTLTYLRTFRLARILKTAGFSQATDAVYRVLYYNRQIMYLSCYVGFLMIFTTSIMLYYFRPPITREDPNEEFQSILSTMYLATLMLTGQGGPEGELPWYTKGVVLLTSAFSIGMFAIPISMLTWGFEAEAERCAKRTRQLELRKRGETFSSSTDEYSTDEEYQKIIAGEESDDGEDDKDNHLVTLFEKLDADGSGSLSLKEFIDLMRESSSSDGSNSNSNGDSANSNASSSNNGAAASQTSRAQEERLSAMEKKIDDLALKVDRLCQALAPASTNRDVAVSPTRATF